MTNQERLDKILRERRKNALKSSFSSGILTVERKRALDTQNGPKPWEVMRRQKNQRIKEALL